MLDLVVVSVFSVCVSEMLDTSIVVEAGSTVVNKYLSELQTFDIPAGVNELVFRFDEIEEVTVFRFDVINGQVLYIELEYFKDDEMLISVVRFLQLQYEDNLQ